MESPVSTSGSELHGSPMRVDGADPDHDTADDKLRALQARMEEWKTTVSAQLREAARKNKSLRDELAAARTLREQELAALRLQLHAEFKERTVLQSTELTELRQRVAQLQAERTALAQTHAEAIAHTELRVRQSCEEEMHTRVAEAVREERHVGQQMRAELQQCRAARDAVTGQYRELIALLDPTLVEHGNSSEVVTAQLHTRCVDALRAHLARQHATLRQELDTAQHEWQLAQTQLAQEVHVREEQLAVLQTLLQQAQAERRMWESRVHAAKLHERELEQGAHDRVIGVEQQLTRAHAELIAARRGRDDALRQLHDALERVRELEDDAHTRDEAIAVLTQSDENKRVVYALQAALQEARAELEQSKSCATAPTESSEGLTISNNTVGESSGVQKSELPPVLTAVSPHDTAMWVEREAACAAREAQLATREQLLHELERQLDETRRSLAEHAATLQRRQREWSASLSGNRATAETLGVDGGEGHGVNAHNDNFYHSLRHFGSRMLRRRPWRWTWDGAAPVTHGGTSAALRTRLTDSARVVFATRRRVLVAVLVLFMVVVLVGNTVHAGTYE